MKLYFTKGACSLASRIVINELGLKCEYESVDLKAKKTETGKNYLTINPKGAVPALETDDGILTENAIIMQYLADKEKAKQLLPLVGDFNRYRVLEWLNYIATELHKSEGLLFNPNTTEEIRDKLIIPLIKTKLSYVDNHLQHHQFLVTDHFTLPDAYLFVMITWTLYFKFNLIEWPNLSRYFHELNKRSSIIKSLKEEGLQLTTA